MKHNEITVIYIITKLELGGAQKVCLSLFNGLKEEHVPLLISGNEGYFAKELKKDPHALLISNFKREVSVKYIFNEVTTFLKIIKRIKNIKKVNQNIIVHTHSTKAGIMGRWAAFFCRVKKRIHTVHGFGFHKHQSWLSWLPAYLLELITSFITTHYICVSSEDVKTGITLFPKFENKHSIIRAAIDLEKFTPAKSDKLTKNCNFTFGTIACFKKQKNLFDLLNAFKLVHTKNPNVKLEIIGDGELKKDIQNWILQNNLNNKIKLHGWQNEVAPIMLTWDTFVLTSLWEGLPCAIVEARALKLPVLSYNTGGIHDVIFHSKNGFLYKQKDWLELASGMLEVSQNNKIHNQLSSFQDNLDDFKNSKMISEHLKLYKDLINP